MKNFIKHGFSDGVKLMSECVNKYQKKQNYIKL